MNIRLQILFNFLSKFSYQINIFVLSIILVRFLDKSEYGTYLQFQLVVNTSLYMLTLGIPHSIYYFYSKVGSQRRYMLTCVSVLMTIGFLMALVINYGDYLGGLLNNSDLNHYAWLIGFAIIFILPYAIIESFLISANRSHCFAVINAVQGFIFFLIVFACLYLGVGLSGIFSSIVALYVGQFLVLIFLIFRYTEAGRCQVQEGAIKKNIRLGEVVRYCLPISLQGTIGSLGNMLDRYIISMNYTPDQFAVYSRGATQLPIVGIIPYSMNGILFKKYTEHTVSGHKDKLFKLWKKAMMQSALVIYPLFVFFLVFATDFIVILYTEQYRDSVPIFQVYMLAMLVKIAIYDTLMRVTGKNRFMPYIAGITIAVNLVLSLILLNYMGIIGPAIATIISLFLNAFLCLLVSKRIYAVGWLDMVPWAGLLKILAISLLSIVPLYVLKSDQLSFIGLAFSGVLFFTIYALLLVVFRLMTVQEIMDSFVYPVLKKLNKSAA